VLLTYSGSVSVDDGVGHDAATLRLTPANAYVVPGGATPLAAVWAGKAPAPGTYRAQATVTIIADGVPVRTLTSQILVLRFASSSAIVIPIIAGIVVGVGAIILVLTELKRRSRRRRRRADAQSALGARLEGFR
jgi:hypothetical protein